MEDSILRKIVYSTALELILRCDDIADKVSGLKGYKLTPRQIGVALTDLADSLKDLEKVPSQIKRHVNASLHGLFFGEVTFGFPVELEAFKHWSRSYFPKIESERRERLPTHIPTIGEFKEEVAKAIMGFVFVYYVRDLISKTSQRTTTDSSEKSKLRFLVVLYLAGHIRQVKPGDFKLDIKELQKLAAVDDSEDQEESQDEADSFENVNGELIIEDIDPDLNTIRESISLDPSFISYILDSFSKTIDYLKSNIISNFDFPKSELDDKPISFLEFRFKTNLSYKLPSDEQEIRLTRLKSNEVVNFPASLVPISKILSADISLLDSCYDSSLENITVSRTLNVLEESLKSFSMNIGLKKLFELMFPDIEKDPKLKKLIEKRNELEDLEDFGGAQRKKFKSGGEVSKYHEKAENEFRTLKLEIADRRSELKSEAEKRLGSYISQVGGFLFSILWDIQVFESKSQAKNKGAELDIQKEERGPLMKLFEKFEDVELRQLILGDLFEIYQGDKEVFDELLGFSTMMALFFEEDRNLFGLDERKPTISFLKFLIVTGENSRLLTNFLNKSLPLRERAEELEVSSYSETSVFSEIFRENKCEIARAFFSYCDARGEELGSLSKIYDFYKKDKSEGKLVTKHLFSKKILGIFTEVGLVQDSPYINLSQLLPIAKYQINNPEGPDIFGIIRSCDLRSCVVVRANRILS